MADSVVAVMRKPSSQPSRKPSKEASRHFDATVVSYDADLSQLGFLEVADFLASSSLGQQLFYTVLTSNPEAFLTFSCGRDLKPSQFKLPVLMPSSQIQSITTMHTTRDSSGGIVQLMLGNDGKRTWIAQIRDSEVHSETTLSYGVNARVVELPQEGILILLEDSYTHGGLLMNNNG